MIADDHADPFVVAVDLLSQAEHGPGLTRRARHHERRAGPSHDGVHRRAAAGPADRTTSPARRGATTAQVLVVDDLDEAFAVADTFAAEHVEVLTDEPRRALDAMHDYGALFLGERTCVSYGDKVIGTNHVLPTRGARPLHRRAVGGQVPEDRHVPGGHRRVVERGAR